MAFADVFCELRRSVCSFSCCELRRSVCSFSHVRRSVCSFSQVPEWLGNTIFLLCECGHGVRRCVWPPKQPSLVHDFERPRFVYFLLSAFPSVCAVDSLVNSIDGSYVCSSRWMGVQLQRDAFIWDVGGSERMLRSVRMHIYIYIYIYVAYDVRRIALHGHAPVLI